MPSGAESLIRMASSAAIVDVVSPVSATSLGDHRFDAQLDEVTREKEQLRSVLEGMVEGVLVVDARRVVLLANSRMRELYEIGGVRVGLVNKWNELK